MIDSLLSVVVPCYNITDKQGLLRACLASLAKQTCGDVEIIIVDDGSTDQSAAAIKAIVENLRAVGWKILFVELPENGGVSVARNAGILEAHGEFVGFLDYDDLWLQEFAEQSLQVLQDNPNIDVVLGGTILYRQYKRNAKAHLIHIPENINEIGYADFCAWHLVNNVNFPVGMGSAVICRRKLFTNQPDLRMDEFLSKLSAEDVFFGLKMLSLGLRPYYLRQPSIVARGFVGILSRSKNAFFALDQKAIIDYLWMNAGRYVYDIVKRDAPTCLPAVDERVSFLNDLFRLRREFNDPEKLFGIRACMKRPRLWRAWMTYWLLASQLSIVRRLFEYRAWKQFQNIEKDLLAATRLVRECEGTL